MKKLFLCFLFFSSTLTAGIPVQGKFLGPTERLIERESWPKVEKKLRKMGVPQELIPFFDSIAGEEDWGHIGYHAANQGFRVYQDVIRFTIEEILGVTVRDDFHFLRVPGDRDLNLNSLAEFYDYWGDKIDNKSEKRGKQLLSLNFGVYSNFDNAGSCSLMLFVKNKSKSKVNYAKKLAFLYEELGISPQELEALFAIGHKWLDEDSGILLRFSENTYISDFSHEAYNFADLHCYPCLRAGYLFGCRPISNHIQRIMTDRYIAKKIDIAPQLRLLINNRYTLNPFSHLIVQRWDLYDPETKASYEAEMREAIRHLRYDPAKAAKYRDKILKMWF